MIWLDDAAPDFAARFDTLVESARDTTGSVAKPVRAIIADVRTRGDAALCDYTRQFDHIDLAPEHLRVSAAEIAAAGATLCPALRVAIDLAAERIEAFHRRQLPAPLVIDDPPGLRMGLRWTPLDAVGLYVPGGKAAYPSSVLMNALPAVAAGVARIALCVPAPGGVVPPVVLAAASRAGVSEIYRVGGAQAIAALAFGTDTIRQVDRIVGPGNAYVAEAKRQVFGQVGIDSVAGPSEVVVVADAANDPRHIALDLLAQAEHDEAAQSILITDSADLARAVAAEVEAVLATLPRAAIAGASWQAHGAIVLLASLAAAPALIDRLAPEHLQVMTAEPAALFAQVRHVGAAFLGRFCPEALGDYVAGPNHVLPTGRSARYASGLSVFDFLKRTTWVEAQAEGLARIGPAAVTLARAEGLGAHAASIAARLPPESSSACA
jgi:histidinol dehydrogenase